MDLVTGLLPHQEAAVEKLGRLRAAALFMEQGTGKTRTALSLIKPRLDRGRADCVLWLCPCSVKNNLREDLRRHTGGDPAEVVVRGIESLSSSDRLYMKLLGLVETHEVFLVVDETALTRNPSAIRTERITAIAGKCPYRLILNGTPISRNEADLFAQFQILDWRILGYRSFYSFAANHLEYHTVRAPDGTERVDRSRVRRVLNTDYLAEKIAPYTYQVTKAECLRLPEKEYRTETFSMADMQREEYADAEQRYLMAVDEIRPETIYKLFAACQHVTAGRRVLSWPESRMRTEPLFQDPRDNPRIRALLDAAEDLEGEKAVIFCKYRSEADDIMAVLPGAVGFTGREPRGERQANLEAFRRDARYLVANRACGAFGLNLQFCRNIIFYDNDFDLATRLQAEDRVHRLGQDRTVRIWDISCPGTIDEFITGCLRRKENAADAFKRSVGASQEEGTWRKYTRTRTSTRRSGKGSGSSSASSSPSTSASREGRTPGSS